MDTWYERLSTVDSLFLDLEDRTAHMHVGACAVFEGPPPDFRDVLRLVESRLSSVPRYRQRVLQVPLKQGRPVWIDESIRYVLFSRIRLEIAGVTTSIS